MGLKTFKKGIYPPTNKELTASLPVEELPLPASSCFTAGTTYWCTG